ncbi:galactosylgalactosylxylosylprotein 3-beta-glucuronosyltransferase 1-like isoform X2 [Apostichopus japonicus]|uniref:galactosylgalactosylxylosylprotein 3-beta-glucuronosyltransferase 1-like isoform X2 n=1 Tax=Stichopus japonicus TaxID=307972 RepID=UPI003AB4F512
MSPRRGMLSNTKFLLFFYIVAFSTVTVWITYLYGFSCEATDKPPPPAEHSSFLEVQMLKAKLKHYEDLSEKSIQSKGEVNNLPFIYAITPTFTRPVQKAELVRLTLAFLHVKNFHWIVVEDSTEKTDLVGNFLQDCGLPFTHLHVKTNEQFQLKSTDPNWKQPRGVDQRNAGIEWLLKAHREEKLKPGVVYFADDDNTYSLQLFREMRHTRKASVWPVGLVGGLRFERPIVSSSGKVTGWYTVWDPSRPFAMDMAGFAINLSLLTSHPEARFDIRSRRGYVESSLLTSLGVTLSDLEPKADNCSKVGPEVHSTLTFPNQLTGRLTRL